MANAASLPEEVWLNILRNLVPPTCEKIPGDYAEHPPFSSQDLARTCRASRKLRRIAEPLLYSSIWLHCRRHKQRSDLLTTLSKRPDLSLHTRNIDYAVAVEFPDDKADEVETKEINGSFSAIKDYIIKHYSRSFADSAEALISNALKRCEEYGGGHRLTMLFLFLILAKNVERVSIVVNQRLERDSGHSILSRLFEQCSLVYDESGLAEAAGHSRPLTNLRTLRLYCSEPHRSCRLYMYYDCIRPMVFMPQLETLELQNILWGRQFTPNGEDDEAGDIQPRNQIMDTGNAFLQLPAYGTRPRLRHFCLAGYVAPHDGMEDILRQFPTLETLELRHGQVDWNPDYWNCNQFGDTLRTYGTNLRRLTIDPEYETHVWNSRWHRYPTFRHGGQLGSLQSLTKLEELRVPLARLIDVEPSKQYTGEELCWKLESIMPANLRWFQTQIIELEQEGRVHFQSLVKYLKALTKGGTKDHFGEGNQSLQCHNLEAVLFKEPGNAEYGEGILNDLGGWSFSRLGGGEKAYRLCARSPPRQDEKSIQNWAMNQARDMGWETCY